MDAWHLYDELLREIERDEAALRLKKLTAEFLSSKLGKRLAPSQQDQNRQLDESKDQLEPRRKTLIQFVQAVIPSFGRDEFSVGDVYDRLATLDGYTASDSPKSRITTVLARLTERGELVQTFRGGGNVPNRYRNPNAFAPASAASPNLAS